MLNNREVAVLVWSALFALWCATIPGVRRSLAALFRTTLHWKVACTILATLAYAALSVLVLEEFGMWTTSQLKDTVVWWLGAWGLTVSLVTSRSEDVMLLRRLATEGLKVTLLVEFLISNYTLPLPAELVLLPIFTFAGLLQAYAGTEPKYDSVRSAMGWFMLAGGAVYLTAAVTGAYADMQKLGSLDTLRSLAITPLLSALYAPFVYVLVALMRYENLFILMRRIIDRSVRWYAKRRILAHIGLNPARVGEFQRRFALELIQVRSRDDVDAIIARSSTSRRRAA